MTCTRDILLLFSLITLGWLLFTQANSNRKKLSNLKSEWIKQYNIQLTRTNQFDCPECHLKIPNSEFHKFQKLQEFSDQQLWNMNIYCIPERFGYSHEQANALFPHIDFPKCSNLLKFQQPFLQLDIQQNELHMNCSGEFTLGINSNQQIIGYRDIQYPLTKYKKPIKLKNREEYAYATCTSKQEFLQQAVYKHRPLQNLKYPQKEDPISIILLVYDSVSRRNFFRKLPKTVQYLNNLSSDFRVFDFKTHNVMGEWSANNLVPMLTGDQEFKMHKEKVEKDLYKQTAIWTEAKKHQFVTLFIQDSCDQDLAQYFGRNLTVDHIGSSFWCAAAKFNYYKNNMPFQRCIGHKNSHTHTYNYIKQFVQNYEKQHKWVFTHINTAHQNSGTVISSLDQDTVDFLDNFLEVLKNTSSVIMMVGDHGMRYGEWFKKLDGSHQHRLPINLFISSQKLLNKIPYSFDTLTHNTKRLNTKLDLYTTQLHLISLSNNSLNLDSKDYSQLKKKTSQKSDSISLFMQKTKNNRTCQQAGVPPFWCSCLKFQQIQISPFQPIVYQLAQSVIQQINQQTHTPILTKKPVCAKLHLKSIKKLWILSTSDDFYKMQLQVEESTSALFEVVISITSEPHRSRKLSDAYPLYPIYQQGKKRSRIMHIRRVDSYAGPCQEKAKSSKILAELCICKTI